MTYSPTYPPRRLKKPVRYLERDALPVVLAGLSDEQESVREVALKAGQTLVAVHGKSHLVSPSASAAHSQSACADPVPCVLL